MTRGLAVMVALLLALTACSDDPAELASESADQAGDRGSPDEPDGDAALGQGLEAATSVFALAALAQDIAPAAEITLVGAGGQDPHSLELSPEDRRAIEDADVVLYMGELGFQPQVERAVADAAGQVVSAAEAVGEQRLLGGPGDDPAEDGDPDPHVWLAPRLMSDVATAIGEAFARVDPDHADAYGEAATAAAEELEAAEAGIDARLSGCAHTRVVLGHEAWAYLLEPRGVEQVGVSGTGGHGGASPQRLAELADLIEEADLPGVFAEPVEGRAHAEAVAREADVELFEVDPLDAPADADEWLERGYLDLLMEQVDTFAAGLRCDGAR